MTTLHRLLPFLFMIILAPQAQAGLFPSFTIQGYSYGCTELTGLDHAIRNQDSSFFRDWTLDDFNVASNWAKTCDWFGDIDGNDRETRLRTIENELLAPQYLYDTEFLLGKRYFGYDRSITFYRLDSANHRLDLNCKGLNAFKAPDTINEESVVEYDWALLDDVVDFYGKSAENCVKNHQMSPENRASLKQELDKTVALVAAHYAQLQAVAAANAAQRAKEAPALEAEERRRAAWSDMVQACRNSQAMRLFLAQSAIIQDYVVYRDASQALEEQRHIYLKSHDFDIKTVDVAINELGNAITAIKTDWANYKELGGRASSPEKVRPALKNPCAAYAFETPPSDFQLPTATDSAGN